MTNLAYWFLILNFYSPKFQLQVVILRIPPPSLLFYGFFMRSSKLLRCLKVFIQLISWNQMSVAGKDSEKQILAMYCLANLTMQESGQVGQEVGDSNLASRTRDSKQVQIARFSGPYLITMLSGDNVQVRHSSIQLTFYSFISSSFRHLDIQLTFR